MTPLDTAAAELPSTPDATNPRGVIGGDAKSKFGEADHIQFRLWELMAATTVFAVFLGLFRLLGIYGALLSFVTAILFTTALSIRPMKYNSDLRIARQQLVKDFIWGICMPTVCLAFDPLIFRAAPGPISMQANIATPMNAVGFVALPILGLQLVAMLTWLTLGWYLRRAAGLFAGLLSVGAIMAYAIAALILPLSLIGLFAGIGVMGLTPWFTGGAYFRRATRSFRIGRQFQSRLWFVTSALVGVLFAVGAPLVFTYLMFGRQTLTWLFVIA